MPAALRESAHTARSSAKKPRLAEDGYPIVKHRPTGDYDEYLNVRYLPAWRQRRQRRSS